MIYQYIILFPGNRIIERSDRCGRLLHRFILRYSAVLAYEEVGGFPDNAKHETTLICNNECINLSNIENKNGMVTSCALTIA